MKKTYRQKGLFSRLGYWAVATGLILLISLVAVWLWAAPAQPPTGETDGNDKIVATVNGEPITAAELDHQMLLTRSATYTYFQQTYHAADGPNFWTTRFGNETPSTKNKALALQKLVTIKVEQHLAKQYGLLDDSSYKTFLANWQAENRRRQRAVEQKQVIYGPVTYTEEAYFDYVFSNMQLRLKDKLAQTEWKISDQELEAYYEQVKTTVFMEEDRVQVAKITVNYHPQDSSSRLQARQQIEAARNRLAQGEAFKQVQANYNERLTESVQTFDAASARYDVQTNPALKEAASRLEIGQLSGIIEENNAFSILKCLAHQKGNPKPFSSVRAAVKTTLIDQKYQQLVNQLVSQADLTQ